MILLNKIWKWRGRILYIEILDISPLTLNRWIIDRQVDLYYRFINRFIYSLEAVTPAVAINTSVRRRKVQ